MSILTIYTRSFHPRENFRSGGLFFHGDNRGFSSDPKKTARIHHVLPFNLKTAKFGVAQCYSDPSSNPKLNEGERVIVGTGPSFQNDYSSANSKPRHQEPGNITDYRPDGNQNVNVRLSYAGKNFAFPGADGVMHPVYGGQVSNGDNYMGDSTLIPFKVQSPVTFEDGIEARLPVKYTGEKWSGMVPDLDVMNNVSLRINRDTKKVDVSSVVTGDGFPNCESFIIDGSNKALFLASHVRTGTAIAQLPGNRQIPMNNTALECDWDADDSFGAQVNVRIALDFTGSGASHDLGTGSKSREQWNVVNTGRSPFGAYSQRVRDHFPLPQSEWIDNKINNNPETVDYIRKGRASVGQWLDDAWDYWKGED
jgi:hypothetical protein